MTERERAPYDTKALFVEEWVGMFGESRRPEAEHEWRLFVDQSRAPSGERVYGPIPEPVFRRIALSWCLRQKFFETRRLAERLEAEWKALLDRAFAELRTALPEEGRDDVCAWYDVEQGLVVEHDCERDQHPGEDEDPKSAAVDAVMQAAREALGRIGITVASTAVMRLGDEPKPAAKAKPN